MLPYTFSETTAQPFNPLPSSHALGCDTRGGSSVEGRLPHRRSGLLRDGGSRPGASSHRRSRRGHLRAWRLSVWPPTKQCGHKLTLRLVHAPPLLAPGATGIPAEMDQNYGARRIVHTTWASPSSEVWWPTMPSRCLCEWYRSPRDRARFAGVGACRELSSWRYRRVRCGTPRGTRGSRT